MDVPKTVEYYSPAGKFSAAGFTVAVIGGALAAEALGFAYGSIQVLMPILYVSFLVTILFATVLGHLVLFFVKLGRVRHSGVATAAVVVGCLAGLYGAWVADRYLRLKMARVDGIEISILPADVFRYIGYFLENGMWSFRGRPVTGLPLLLIWLAEASLVFALAIKAVRVRFRSLAYCEACRRWTRSTRGVRHLVPNASHGLTQELQKGNVQPLLQTLPSSRGAPLSLRVDIDQCGGCAGSVYLSLTVVAGGTRFREFVWPEEKALVRHVRIAPAEADALRAPQKLADIVPPGKTRPKARGAQESGPPERP